MHKDIGSIVESTMLSQIELERSNLPGSSRQAFPRSNRNSHSPHVSPDSSPTTNRKYCSGSSPDRIHFHDQDDMHLHDDKRRHPLILSVFRKSKRNNGGATSPLSPDAAQSSYSSCSEDRSTPDTHSDSNGYSYISEEWSNLLYQTPPKKVIVFRD
eukprot:m.169027 g.169027  ORF g.169027 m.169027 type:complete len:156 (+) comp31546_c0_seq1:637-1104(+)